MNKQSEIIKSVNELEVKRKYGGLDIRNQQITPSQEKITWLMNFATVLFQYNRKICVLNIITILIVLALVKK